MWSPRKLFMLYEKPARRRRSGKKGRRHYKSKSIVRVWRIHYRVWQP